MNFQRILCLLIALTMISPVVMAKEKKQKKKKVPIGKLISITDDTLVVKIKKEEKTYTITEETKIVNKNGEEIAVEDCKFKYIELTADPEDAEKITEIKEKGKNKKKGNKKKKKKKKTDDDDSSEGGDDSDA